MAITINHIKTHDTHPGHISRSGGILIEFSVSEIGELEHNVLNGLISSHCSMDMNLHNLVVPLKKRIVLDIRMDDDGNYGIRLQAISGSEPVFMKIG